MKIKNSFLLMSLFLAFNGYGQTMKETKLTSYVDPFIGTLGEGNVYAGACLPHSFVKLGPDCKSNSGAAGYKKNKDIEGFSHLHISGMGGPMYGNIQLMPTTGPIVTLNHSSATENEKASPGFYKVGLTKYKTKAELTSTAHAGFHRYTFPETEKANILIDVGATLYGTSKGWNSSIPIGGEVNVDEKNNAVYGFNTFEGGRSTTKPWQVYFYAIFDTPFKTFGTWRDSVKFDQQKTIKGNEIGAYLTFMTKDAQQIMVKVGISMINESHAKQNMEKEISDWDFEGIKKKAEDSWEKELSKIEINGTSETEKKIFYTALYHTLLMPSDWTGENPVFDFKRPYYEDFLCVWDIFRTVSPLMTLISTQKQVDMLNTLLDIYKKDGWLPDAHSALQREHIQVGTNADVLFSDAFVKGLKGIDYNLAFEAMKKNAEDTLIYAVPSAGRIGLSSYKKNHFVAADASFPGRRMTVSRTLEYVYDDFCIYQLAKGLKRDTDASRYLERSFWYKNHWDPKLKLMRGKNTDGSWSIPFNPNKSETGNNFYEGQAYTWTYTAPHDVKGLINLFGDKEIFVDSLTKSVSSHYEAFNEPCMLQIYLFVWAGRPDLTQKFVRKATKENFTADYDGLPGNDDSGTTSAWYVWSRMGIFPVAGQNLYIVGSPSAEKTTIHLESGKDILILAKNASEKNIYIQSAKLNGKPYDKAFFSQDEIRNGAKFEFIMGEKPSIWGRKMIPPSLSDAFKK
jgi:predicted alpha-1,2-mannosidase